MIAAEEENRRKVIEKIKMERKPMSMEELKMHELEHDQKRKEHVMPQNNGSDQLVSVKEYYRGRSHVI